MSQASQSKEPSMDEILASIRRIIESSDEKPGASLASSAARVAAADRAALARDGASERGTSFTLPAQAARVVPFTDHASVATPPPAGAQDSDERWMPATEPANSAGEPPKAERHDVAVEAEPAAMSATIEPFDAAGRWAQELDDADNWVVLDHPEEVHRPEVRPETDAPADLVLPTEVEARAEIPPKSDDRIEPAAFTRDVEPAATESEAVASPETEDDFIVDFDEADFVEALDRNAALVTSRDVAEAAVPAEGPKTTDAEVSQPVSPPQLATGDGQQSLPAFYGARASLVAASAEPAAAAPEPSVVQQASVLMSEQAGTQVAAAFDDLARAIRDGQMTSMEDMSRELLRPMLQEWLDDNLPRLVERLVREEIERVSRGPRR